MPISDPTGVLGGPRSRARGWGAGMAGALLGSPLGLGSPELSEGRPTVTSEHGNEPGGGGSDVPQGAPEGFWQVRPTRGLGGLRVPGPSLPARPNPAQPSPRRVRTPGLPGRGARLRGRLGLSGAQRSLLRVPVLLLFWFWARPRPPGGRLRFPLRSRPGGPSPVLSSPLLSSVRSGPRGARGLGRSGGGLRQCRAASRHGSPHLPPRCRHRPTRLVSPPLACPAPPCPRRHLRAALQEVPGAERASRAAHRGHGSAPAARAPGCQSPNVSLLRPLLGPGRSARDGPRGERRRPLGMVSTQQAPSQERTPEAETALRMEPRS